MEQLQSEIVEQAQDEIVELDLQVLARIGGGGGVPTID